MKNTITKFGLLLHAMIKKQRKSMIGILLLIFLAGVCGFSAITLYTSGIKSVTEKMEGLGFGDFTIWVNNEPQDLASQLKRIPELEKLVVQPLIYADYEINGTYSDNEGQLLYDDGTVSYQMINKAGENVPFEKPKQGEIYISPAMQSSYDVDTGDTIQFELSRTAGKVSFTVAGYFEDAFMGSSMIDMKSFLINKVDYDSMKEHLEAADTVNVLGKTGAMYHIYQSSEGTMSQKEFQQKLYEDTEIARYISFSYTKATILNYMLLLQKILTGFFLAFAVILLIVCAIIVSHSLMAVVEQDKKNIAVLKSLGLSGSQLSFLYFILYGGLILAGIILSCIPVFSLTRHIAEGMVSTTGLRIRIHLPIGWITVSAILLLLVFLMLIYAGTRRILTISPMQTIRQTISGKRVKSAMSKKHLAVSIAVRQLLSEKKKYVALFVISAFLVFFLSILGRMGSWLGPDGEGLMNAFSVADHDLGVQPFNQSIPMDEIERVINWYSPIEETYELAMEPVTVNGQEYTANILNDTKWFHLLEGKVCDGNSILITETVANEQDLVIGDEVQVSANGRTKTYEVSGIYQCANGMGSNLGMSLAGYSLIGDITGFIWCHHYILEDGSVREYVMTYLQEHYRGIDVHTNSWSGLSGIVVLMHGLIAAVYMAAGLVILISVMLVSSKLFVSETRDMAIYKSMGMSVTVLRISFAVRFLLVSMGGSILGMTVAAISAGQLIQILFRQFGIGEFFNRFSLLGTVVPFYAIPLLFFGAAWIYSRKMNRISIVKLIAENSN